MLGSYPEFSNPEYKVKVTLESKDRGYLDAAVGELPGPPPEGGDRPGRAVSRRRGGRLR